MNDPLYEINLHSTQQPNSCPFHILLFLQINPRENFVKKQKANNNENNHVEHSFPVASIAVDHTSNSVHTTL